jgi:phage/plasmid-associated DNA primase
MSDDASEEWVMTRKAEIESFITKILPNRRVRTFVMTLLASFLSGDTNEEHFHIWTGSGGNGKSKLLELFESSIGDYACKLPVSLLTGKRQASSGATPELANLKGRRFACLQEPSEGSRIDAGLMKELTGGDKIYARALFKEPIEFKPQFKLVLACNDPPEMPKGDGGVWRRVKMVNFPSKFKERGDLTDDDGHWNADKTIWTPKDAMKPVFPADESIDQKFKDWKDVFLWMLLEQYKVYKTDGLVIPDEVKATTNDYRQSQFKLGEFIKDKIVIDTDCMEQHTISEIYDQYKDWFMESQGGNKKEMLKRQDVAQYMESYFGEHLVAANTYTHIRLNEEPARGGGYDTISRYSGQGSLPIPSDEPSDEDMDGLEDET